MSRSAGHAVAAREAVIRALRSVLPLAEPHERGGLLSTIYVLSYLAFSLPAIAAGLLLAAVAGTVTVAVAIAAAVLRAGGTGG